MSLETRARDAAEGLRVTTMIDPEAGLDRLRRTYRRRNATRVVGVGVAAAIAVFVAGPRLTGNSDHAEPGPAAPPSSTLSPPPSSKPIDTTTWTTYTSEQYGFKVGHPPDWSEIPATREGTVPRDILHWHSSAHDGFLSPDGNVLVTVWNAPLEPGTHIESTTDLSQWVKGYCEQSDSHPCSGIRDRAVDLCLEARDCHPGLLVPFNFDAHAFFSGGIYDARAMTIVSIWQPESAPSLLSYGGAQRLLKGFLSTMAVWPASTPFEERECYGQPPSGLECQSKG